MHRILTRQIKKHLGDTYAPSPELSELFEVVSKTYTDFDEDHALIEHSLEVSSKELSGLVSVLQATLDATNDGILVVNSEGEIVNHNRRFLEIWNITHDAFARYENYAQLEAALAALAEAPDLFTGHTQEVMASPEEESTMTILLSDGRVVVRYSKPQRVEEKIVGRVWSFRDVTEQRRAEVELKKKLEMLERLNKSMVNRELRMIELKKKIAELSTVDS